MCIRRAAVIVAAVLALGGCSSAGDAPGRSPSAPRVGVTGTALIRSTSPSTSPTISPTISPTTSSAPSSVAPSTPAPATPSARSSSAPVITISAAARRAGLVDIHAVVPDAIVDLRYATGDNVTHVRLYPTDAHCLVHTSLRAGLRTAAARLRAQGYRLVFWDCYRPHPVQVRMFRIVPDPEFVARPGTSARSHEAGRSVDVTLSKGGHLLSMGTGFDDFTARAHAFATDGVSATAQAHRAVLRRAMAAGGVTVYSGEWWHFDGPGADVGRPFLKAPLH